MKQSSSRGTGDLVNGIGESISESIDAKTSWVDVVTGRRGVKNTTNFSKKVN